MDRIVRASFNCGLYLNGTDLGERKGRGRVRERGERGREEGRERGRGERVREGGTR